MLTIPFYGVQWPAMTFVGDEPPEWWLGNAHRASELEQDLSNWKWVRQALRAGTILFEDPFPWP